MIFLQRMFSHSYLKKNGAFTGLFLYQAFISQIAWRCSL